MKYKVEPITRGKNFSPFVLTLTFETKEEYEKFHDEIMGQLTNVDSHEFHGAIFLAGSYGEAREGKI